MRLSVSEAVYRHARIGRPIDVPSHRGRLGVAWLAIAS
jgi:hypothetical protein